MQTEAVIPRLAAIADPADRLRTLTRAAAAATQNADLALRLLVESEDPAVRTVVQRVSLRRLRVIEGAFRELGCTAATARHYAAGMYAAYLGTAALRRADAAPEDAEPYTEALLAAFGVPA